MLRCFGSLGFGSQQIFFYLDMLFLISFDVQFCFQARVYWGFVVRKQFGEKLGSWEVKYLRGYRGISLGFKCQLGKGLGVLDLGLFLLSWVFMGDTYFVDFRQRRYCEGEVVSSFIELTVQIFYLLGVVYFGQKIVCFLVQLFYFSVFLRSSFGDRRDFLQMLGLKSGIQDVIVYGEVQ